MLYMLIPRQKSVHFNAKKGSTVHLLNFSIINKIQLIAELIANFKQCQVNEEMS